jgi:hypothetical protein
MEAGVESAARRPKRPPPRVQRVSRRRMRRSTAKAWGWGFMLALLALQGGFLLGGSPVAWIVCGAAFVGWFAATLPGGVLDRLDAAEARRRRAAHSDAPWMRDHPWDSTGERITVYARLRRNNPGLLFQAVSAPIVVLGALTNPRLPVWTAALYVAAPLVGGSIVLWRGTAMGTARVSFAKFPFHPGERVALHFGTVEGGATFERVAFRLVCVLEKPVVRFRVDRFDVSSPCGYDERPPGALPGPEQDVEVVFDLPAAALLDARRPGRDLRRTVRGELPRPDLRAPRRSDRVTQHGATADELAGIRRASPPPSARRPLAAARVRRRRAARPDEPWLSDHAWDAGGASVGPLLRGRA